MKIKRFFLAVGMLCCCIGCSGQNDDTSKMKGNIPAREYGLQDVLVEKRVHLQETEIEIEITFSVPRDREDYEFRLFFTEISGVEEIKDLKAPREILAAMLGFSFKVSSDDSIVTEYVISDPSFGRNHAFNFGKLLSFWLASSVSLQEGKKYRVFLRFPGLDPKSDQRLAKIAFVIGIPRNVHL